MAPPTNGTRPRKRTTDENAKACLRLRRQLEDSLIEGNGNCAERRILKALIDLLYSVNIFGTQAEIIVDSVRNLTQRGRLRYACSGSTYQVSPALFDERKVCVQSPSEQFRT